MYELFEHTADLGLRVVAPTLPALFEDAAAGLFAMIVERPPDFAGATERRFELRGDRRDWLLFDWLAELLYLFDTEHVLCGRFCVALEADGLRGRAAALPIDPVRDRLLHEVKAITYHGLCVERAGAGWTAEVIVDI